MFAPQTVFIIDTFRSIALPCVGMAICVQPTQTYRCARFQLTFLLCGLTNLPSMRPC